MDQRDENAEERELIIDASYEKRLEGRGVAQEKVRHFNRQLILKYLRDHGSVLRTDMAKNLGLSRATVTIIVKQLLDEHLVREGDKTHSSGGKPATRIEFNANFGHILGIDIGRSRWRMYLTNLAADIVAQATASFGVGVDLKGVLDRIAREASELVANNLHDGWKSVRGIGIGIPGVKDSQATDVMSSPMLKRWSDIADYLREQLKQEPSFPIFLDNDANMGALGESRYGKGRGVRNMVYIKLSMGIGAGLILDGKLYGGESGAAGEFGHSLIQFGESLPKDSPTCLSCGQQGCLESLTGLRAIVNDARQHSSSELLRSIPEHAITPEHMVDVITEADRGDNASRLALEIAGARIGAAIGSHIVNFYNPALILLDGGIVRPTKKGQTLKNNLLLNKLQQSARQASLSAAYRRVSISFGKLDDDAVGLGAVAAVIDRDAALNMPADI